jgi:hypothetical protein
VVLLSKHAAADLAALDQFEEGAEISLAEPLVAPALNSLEKNRADHGPGEGLR